MINLTTCLRKLITLGVAIGFVCGVGLMCHGLAKNNNNNNNNVSWLGKQFLSYFLLAIDKDV